MSGESEITTLLAAFRNGDRSAIGRLFPLVYREFHRRAHQQLARRRPGETLSATALSHETYLKLSLRIYRRELSADYPRVAEARTALGQTLTDREPATDAEPFLRQAITMRAQQLRAQDLRDAESRAALGVTLGEP